MDDSCAVCAETLEWVAYGGCGHKDVCSTCVARLRFICDDRRCCICKAESDVVFVTKALGNYTRIIGDFSVLPSEPREGRVGSYWYHGDTQAFFDDVDHYKMIQAMCKLSCSVCDKLEEQPRDGSRRRTRFRNIEQLKGHLFHQHRLLMCRLCLEGRKVFICEQKLYTRAQLNQHISSGDSEVDGSESERGGFTGHPMCEFCRSPFYGDNELYSHMSTEHYTCHICQRQHPGQYEYYKNYDDLEIHFRRDHFLCEDETCLEKKFIVFQSEAELKRHNTIEHGGRMSRSKRNAALQIPTSFRYRRSNERDNRRGRGHTFQRDTSENDLSVAIEASLETANLEGQFPDMPSSGTWSTSAPGEINDVDPLISPFESSAMTDSEATSRYLHALSHDSRNAPLQESSFPPLPMAPSSSQMKVNQDAAVKNTMAAHLRRQKIRNLNVQSSVSARPVASHTPAPLANSPQLTWPLLNSGASGTGSSSGQSKLAVNSGPTLSIYSSSTHARPPLVPESSSSSSYSPSYAAQNAWPSLSSSSGSASNSGPSMLGIENGKSLSSYVSSIQAQPAMLHEASSSGFYSSSRMKGRTSKIGHSSSAPNLVDGGSFDSSVSDFPPVSAAQVRKLPTDSQVTSSIEDIHVANKSLVERMNVALGFDHEKYNNFKDISAEYRQGLIDAETYLVYVEQFGLSHLLLELAQLCPDSQKQKELIETYNANMLRDTPQKNERSGAFSMKDVNGSKKGKAKSSDSVHNNSKDNLADGIMSNVRKLQLNYKPSEEVEVLTKDGYRATKSKSKVYDSQADLVSPGEPIKVKDQTDPSFVAGSNQNSGEGDGKSKQQKKKSKFHRVRLGDGSAASILDLKNSNSDPDSDQGSKEAAAPDGQNHATEGLPARGVWRNGGGQKLLAMTSRGPQK